MAVITYQGKATGKSSTGITANRLDINTETGEITGQPDKTAILTDLRHRAERLFADCRVSGRVVDVNQIKNALFSADALYAQSYTVQQLVDEWIICDRQRYEVGEIAQRTLWKDIRWTNDFWAFVVGQYGKDALLSQIKPADARAFVLWLKQHRRLSNNTAQATVSHARVLMSYALDMEWLPRNPFINFRRKMDTVERVTLSEDEIR